MVELLKLFQFLLFDPRFHHYAKIVVSETFSFLMLAPFRIFLLELGLALLQMLAIFLLVILDRTQIDLCTFL